MKNKTVIAAFVTGIILSMSFGIYLFIRESKDLPLPVYGVIKPFELVDSGEKLFSQDNLKGKVWVADFFFTTCGTICPIMSKNMASLHRSFNLEDDVRFVSISVNPDNDTPERLKEYAKGFQADTSKWFFLTGKREDIKDLAVKSFRIGSVEEPIFHSPSFVLVDKNAQIRGYYDGTSDKAIRLLFVDLAKLLKE